MNFPNLQKTDPELHALIWEEMQRQETSLELIPSECIASASVIEWLGTPFTNKYSEWYPGKRYYWWNEVVDKLENIAISRAKIAFPWVAHVNVQAYSGSPANMAVFNAICDAWDTIMWLALSQWGHLTHGHSVSASAKFFNAVQFWLNSDGYIDLEEVERLALEHKPKLMIVWFTAYSREFPFAEFRRIADMVWAYLLADISHIAWLVVAWEHTSPSPYVDVIMTTTHKTLKWPRGALIMTTEKGLEKDPDLASKIDKSVFPGLQWGPHNHQTLAIAVALWEAITPEFKEISKQTVKNAKVLAEELATYGFDIAAWGTDNHLVLAGVWKGRGWFIQDALDIAGITVNKNTIPSEPCSPFNPSGIRMGTPILSMRGMKEVEVKQVAFWMNEVSEIVKDFTYLETKEDRIEQKKKFKEFISTNTRLQEIRKDVAELCMKFPIYK